MVDSSDADPRSQIAAVREVLAEIGARDVPELVVFNKADAADSLALKGLQLAEPQSVAVSAKTGDGLPVLLAEIERLLPQAELRGQRGRAVRSRRPAGPRPSGGRGTAGRAHRRRNPALRARSAWSGGRNFGPIWIPKKGATVNLTLANICLYERIMDLYEENELEKRDGKVLYQRSRIEDLYL